VETYETRLDEGNVRPARRLRPRLVDCGQLRTRYVVNDAAGSRGFRGPRRDHHKFEGDDDVPPAPVTGLFRRRRNRGRCPTVRPACSVCCLGRRSGCIQTTEAIKTPARHGETLDGRVLFYDAMDMTFELHAVPAQPRPGLWRRRHRTIEDRPLGGCRVDATDSQRPVRHHRRPAVPSDPSSTKPGADAPAAVLVFVRFSYQCRQTTVSPSVSIRYRPSNPTSSVHRSPSRRRGRSAGRARSGHGRCPALTRLAAESSESPTRRRAVPDSHE